MNVLLTVLVATFFANFVVSTPCKTSGIACVDSLHFHICVNIGGNALLIGQQPLACPEGTICNDDAFFACQPGTPPATTTPLPPVTPPTCVQHGLFPAPKCSQYYECGPMLWWWTYWLNDCPQGHIFSSAANACVIGSADNC